MDMFDDLMSLYQKDPPGGYGGQPGKSSPGYAYGTATSPRQEGVSPSYQTTTHRDMNQSLPQRPAAHTQNISCPTHGSELETTVNIESILYAAGPSAKDGGEFWNSSSTIPYSPTAPDSGLSQSLPSSFGASPGLTAWDHTKELGSSYVDPLAPHWEQCNVTVTGASSGMAIPQPMQQRQVHPSVLSGSPLSPIGGMRNLRLNDMGGIAGMSPQASGKDTRFNFSPRQMGAYPQGGSALNTYSSTTLTHPEMAVRNRNNLSSVNTVTTCASPEGLSHMALSTPGVAPLALCPREADTLLAADCRPLALRSPSLYSGVRDDHGFSGRPTSFQQDWPDMCGELSPQGLTSHECPSHFGAMNRTPRSSSRSTTAPYRSRRNTLDVCAPFGSPSGTSVPSQASVKVKAEGLSGSYPEGVGYCNFEASVLAPSLDADNKRHILDDITSIIAQEGEEMDGVPQTGPFMEYGPPANIFQPRRLVSHSFGGGGGGDFYGSPRQEGERSIVAARGEEGHVRFSGVQQQWLENESMVEDMRRECDIMVESPATTGQRAGDSLGIDSLASASAFMKDTFAVECEEMFDAGGPLGDEDTCFSPKELATGLLEVAKFEMDQVDSKRSVLDAAAIKNDVAGFSGCNTGNVPLNVYEFDDTSADSTPPGAALQTKKKRHMSSAASSSRAQARTTLTPRLRRDSDRGHRILHKRHHNREDEINSGLGQEAVEGGGDRFNEHRRRRSSFSTFAEDDWEMEDDRNEGCSSDTGEEDEAQPIGHSVRTSSSRSTSRLPADEEREPIYFWQYNSHSKGPRGQRFDIKVMEVGHDPHEPAPFVDPVFDPEQNIQVSHVGRQRKGDGTDVTPDPIKLYMIGQELETLAHRMGEVGGSALGGAKDIASTSKREKNKLASRACRLKKKAQHEADKIKLHGLGEEHKGLLKVLGGIKEAISSRKARRANPGGQAKLCDTLTGLERQHLAGVPQVAGRMTAYVKDVVEEVEASGKAAKGYNSESSDDN